jgi:hypothetical protein
MSELKFSKSVDTDHEVKLESTLVSAAWSSGRAVAGTNARFEIRTCFVGDGASVEVKGKTENGKKLGKVSDVIRGNIYVGELEIPGDVEEGDLAFFEYKLSKNGISGESEHIPVAPAVEITSIKWGAKEARRGDIVTLSAEVTNIPDQAEVKLVIYEHDQDGAHDRITEVPAICAKGKIETKWEYEYHEDTDEVPTDEEMKRYGRSYNPPEYFFTIVYEGSEYGRNAKSGLLLFKDSVEIELTSPSGAPIANEDYTLVLPDGTTRKGKLDLEGRAVERGIPPGKYRVEFPNL